MTQRNSRRVVRRGDATTGRTIEEIIRSLSLPRDVDNKPDATRKTGGKTKVSQTERSPGRAVAAIGFAALHLDLLLNQASEQATVAPPPLPPPDDSVTLESDLDTTNESTPSSPVPDSIELPWLGEIRVQDWGLPVFTLVVGFVDGFNPCAMWVLVFLLSVLVNVKSRWRIMAVAGTFVLVSGLAYFAFMAAWMNLFLLIGFARPLQVALGCLAILVGLINVKDFFAFHKGVSLSIPESAKPGIYVRVRHIVTTEYLSVAVGSAVVLAIVVNTVELLCTAGLPALYTQILSAQQLSVWKNYGCLALYILAYMADDSLLLATFVITLSHHKLQRSEGRWLKLVSGLVILILGAVLIARPEWLQLV